MCTHHAISTLGPIQDHAWVLLPAPGEAALAGAEGQQAPVPGHLPPPRAVEFSTHSVPGRRTRDVTPRTDPSELGWSLLQPELCWCEQLGLFLNTNSFTEIEHLAVFPSLLSFKCPKITVPAHLSSPAALH